VGSDEQLLQVVPRLRARGASLRTNCSAQKEDTGSKAGRRVGSGLGKAPKGFHECFRQRIAILFAEEFVAGAVDGKQLITRRDER
jgi:hypothetical protein